MATAIPLDSLTIERAEKLKENGARVYFKYHGKERRGVVEDFDEHLLTLHLPETYKDGAYTKDKDDYKSFAIDKIESAFLSITK